MDMTISEYFESIKKNKAKLRQFIAAMPKGGDLHNHLTGAAYAELYFEIACKKKLYVDYSTGKLYTTRPDPSTVSDISKVKQLPPDPKDLHESRMKLIDKWSIRNYQPYKYALGPDEYFFSEFGMFGAAASDEDLPDLLHELLLRAKEENVQYLEIIGISPKAPDYAGLSEAEYNDYNNKFIDLCDSYYDYPPNKQVSLEELSKKVIESFKSTGCLNASISEYIQRNKDLAASVLNVNNCGKFLTSRFDTAPLLLDDVAFRFQGYASRTGDPVMVLAQLYIVYEAMTKIPDILVGCNFVAAENSENSMRFYRAHMAMFYVIRSMYTEIPKTALHAGELTMGLIRPEHLTYHIGAAVNYYSATNIYVTLAERIGHGVDIAFEHDSFNIIQLLKGKNIAVEINLTSNEFILGVKDDAHPFMLYKDNDVPMVISTDDPGILRTSLTEEYTLAVLRYDLDYSFVKKLTENSIDYSFLSDKDKATVKSDYQDKYIAFENMLADTLGLTKE
jgi:adenosine deaminase